MASPTTAVDSPDPEQSENDLTDLGTKKMKCAICRDNFKSPKLLLCGHTFCLDCLNKISSSSKNQDWIVCAVCRKRTTIPKHGMGNFMTNYFVDSIMDVSICQVCEQKVSVLEICHVCGLEMCHTCFSYHCESQNIGKNRCVKSNNTDNECQLKMLQNLSKTIYCSTLKFSFHCAQKVCIEKILPLENNDSWILTRDSQEVVRYNNRGHRLSSIKVLQRIGDICQQNDNCLLILCSDAKSLFQYKNDEVIQIVEMVDHYPWRLLSLDGLIAIAVTTDTADCKLLFYDDAFTQICSYDKTEIEPIKHISSMCYKFNTRTICLADEVSGCVHMIKETGSSVTFNNKLHTPISDCGGRANNVQSSGFKPTSLCCDSEGNLCVYDDVTCNIFIVDTEAKVIGMVLTDEECGRGVINYVTFDRSGKLWLGDGSTGIVHVYTVDEACNDLDRHSIPANNNARTGNQTITHGEDEKAISGELGYLSPSSQNDAKGMVHSTKRHEGNSKNSSQISPHGKLHGSDIMTYNQYDDNYKIPDKKTINKESPGNQMPAMEHQFKRSNSAKPFEDIDVPKTFGGQRVITIPIPMGINGIPLSDEEYDQLAGHGSLQVSTQQSTGSLSVGVHGTYLSLPPHIVSNPHLKQYVLKKIAKETGISEERLANSLKSPKGF